MTHTAARSLCDSWATCFIRKMKKNRFWGPLWELGATWAVHLRLIGNLVGDFLLVIIELSSLGAFVLSQFTRLTDRQTDRRTDGQMFIRIPRLHTCSAVKWLIVSSMSRSESGRLFQSLSTCGKAAKPEGSVSCWQNVWFPKTEHLHCYHVIVRKNVFLNMFKCIKSSCKKFNLKL